jgi:hypothetical protein
MKNRICSIKNMITDFFNFQNLNEARTPEFAFERNSKVQSILGEPITLEIIQTIFDADPTREKIYVYWIISLFKAKSQRNFLEDLDRVTSALTTFERIKRILPERQRNIFNFKTLNDLEDLTAQYEEDTEIAVSNRQKRGKGTPVDGEYQIIYEDDSFMIILPRTYRAACYWGRGTRWCTAFTENDRYYISYADQGQLYIIFDKKQERSTYQFHFETNSYMDINDNRINLAEFYRNHPQLEQAITLDRVRKMGRVQSIEGLISAITNQSFSEIDLQIELGGLEYAKDYIRYGDNILGLTAKTSSKIFCYFASKLPDDMLSELVMYRSNGNKSAMDFLLRTLTREKNTITNDDIENIRKTIKRCVRLGFDLNYAPNGDYTLLHEACQYGLPFMVKCLLELGANPNVSSERENYETPMMNLFDKIRDYTIDIVEMVLDHNYNPDLQDGNGKTAMHYAIFLFSDNKEKNDIVKKIIELLLEADADLNIPDNTGNTPMHTYAVSKNAGVLEMLISKGGDVRKTRNDGKTPMDIAKMFKNKEFSNIS